MIQAHNLNSGQASGTSRQAFAQASGQASAQASGSESSQYSGQSSIQPKPRSYHSLDEDTNHVYLGVTISESLGVIGAAQVRLVGLPLNRMPEDNPGFYLRNLSKPLVWHLWLRNKVSALIQFLVDARASKSSKLPQGFSLRKFDWFICADDDTYFQVTKFREINHTLFINFVTYQ